MKGRAMKGFENENKFQSDAVNEWNDSEMSDDSAELFLRSLNNQDSTPILSGVLA